METESLAQVSSRSRTTHRLKDERIKKQKVSSDSDSDEDPGAVSDNNGIVFSTLGDSDKEFPTPPFVASSASTETQAKELESDRIKIKEESDTGDTVKKESWWELDAESGKYIEKGPNLRGFKMKLNMKVKVEDQHLHRSHMVAGNGNIKCHVKVENVREELGIKHGTLDQPIKMSTHTLETHPLICPFACPETNTPCEASFLRIDQRYFVDHVINGKCPYSKGKNLEDFLPARTMICDICNEEVSEREAQDHMDQKHFKIACPACKGRHEDRVSVEDHIINKHATHFMSSLTSIYRKTKTTIRKLPEVEEENDETVPERSDYQTLEDLLREKVEYDALIKEQAQYLAGLKGPDQKHSVNRFLLNIAPTPNSQTGPTPLNLQMKQAFRTPGIPRNHGPQTLRGPRPQMSSGARGLVTGTQQKLQQVKMKNGELMWAMSSEIPAIGPGQSARMLFKIVCPVIAGAPPPVVLKSAGPSALAPKPTILKPLKPTILRAPVRAVRPGPTPRQTSAQLAPLRFRVQGPGNYLHNTSFVRPEPPVRRNVPFKPRPSNGSTDHDYGGSIKKINVNRNITDHSYERSKEGEMDDEIEEVDPLALDEGVDPLAGLDPYDDDVTIVS